MLMTFLYYKEENIMSSEKMFTVKENQIEQLSHLMQLNHPNIVNPLQIFVERFTITLISEYYNAPSLFPFICKQK
jgi:hypothetical protein